MTGKEADLIVEAEAAWTINLPSCQIDQLAFPQTNGTRGARAQGEHVILGVLVLLFLLVVVKRSGVAKTALAFARRAERLIAMAAVIGDLTQASNLVDTEWDAAPDADSTVPRANLFMAMPARAKACVGTDATRASSSHIARL